MQIMKLCWKRTLKWWFQNFKDIWYPSKLHQKPKKSTQHFFHLLYCKIIYSEVKENKTNSKVNKNSFQILRIQILWSSAMIVLNVRLHQSLITTSSSKKATIGSLDTALSSIQTSVTSVCHSSRKTELLIKN